MGRVTSRDIPFVGGGGVRSTDRRLRAAERGARKLEARMRAEARMGLSSCHIRTRHYAEVSPTGSLLGVKTIGARQCVVPTAKRGPVHEFTRRSRARMLRRFAVIRRTALSSSLLVTL